MSVSYHISPTLSGGKVFYEVIRVEHHGMFAPVFRTTIDYVTTKKKAEEIIEEIRNEELNKLL